MKKTIYFLIFIFSISRALPHEQQEVPVHQRIVYEAYQLLKIQLSKEENGIADLDFFVGDIENYGHYTGTLTGGSWQEDRYDIVYHYSGIFNSHTSITHFWDADNPYGKVKLYDGGSFPSAYTKALRFINDDYAKFFEIPLTVGFEMKACSPEANGSLHKWYWNDKIWVSYSYKYIPLLNIYYDVANNYYWPVGNLQCRLLYFNFLGRLCHLLTDMGVPEHAKRSMHPRPNNAHTAPFEHWLAHKQIYREEFYWTAERVLEERGGFVNPFCEVDGDKTLYLFYTLAQLSDHFGSFGTRPSNGNTNYNIGIGEIESIVKSYFPNEEFFYTKPDFMNNIKVGWAEWELTRYAGRAFRDALLPYTIRATAGLLYRFIIESKMQFPDATEFDMGTIYDQQQELNLFNQNINGNYYTYRAEGTPGRITVCPDERPIGYDADFVIGPEARNVTFRASNEIIFKPGFIATEGSEVRAYVVPNCSRTNQSGNCQECLDEDYNPKYDKSIQ
ncbi:MAG: hypothetical protein M9949_02750 [Candidatus Kapabacteria bacterium]|nr:hypothetical protein [Candidatus Kapabacteria bacterium]